MAADSVRGERQFADRHPILWLVGSCMFLVLSAAVAFAVIVAGASVALATHQSSEETQASPAAVSQQSATADPATAFSGVITDSRCGARHLRNSRMTSAECAKACVRKGASYVLVNGDRRYTLSGSEDALRRLAGTRASVFGTRQGDTILVSSVRSAF